MAHPRFRSESVTRVPMRGEHEKRQKGRATHFPKGRHLKNYIVIVVYYPWLKKEGVKVGCMMRVSMDEGPEKRNEQKRGEEGRHTWATRERPARQRRAGKGSSGRTQPYLVLNKPKAFYKQPWRQPRLFIRKKRGKESAQPRFRPPAFQHSPSS